MFWLKLVFIFFLAVINISLAQSDDIALVKEDSLNVKSNSDNSTHDEKNLY